MKKRSASFAKMLSIFAFAILTFVAVGSIMACSGMDASLVLDNFSGGAIGVSTMALPIWVTMVKNAIDDKEVKTFKELDEKAYDGLEEEDQLRYINAMIKSNREGFNELKGRLTDADESDSKAVKALETEFKEFSVKMLNSIEKQAEVMADIQRNGSSTSGKSEIDYSITINAIEKAKDVIENFKAGEIKSLEFNIKSIVVPGDVQASTASQRENEIGKIPVRKTPLVDLFTKSPMSEGRNNGKITFVDQDTLVRNADNVAKCGPVPESDINWIEASCDVEKIGDSIKVCQAALEDYDFIANEIDQFLRENIRLKFDQQLLLGTGVTPQLKGVIASAQAWSVAPGSPIVGLALQVQAPTIGDVISTALKQIENSGQNNSYVPNAILMNPTDVELMLLTKDLDNNADISRVVRISDDGTVFVKGVAVIENNIVPQNEAYAGDFKKGTIYMTRELNIKMTDSNASEFLSDVSTIKGTMRAALVIRNVWADAFIHVADINAAIVALTKP
jgi:hypothetical protein